mgnify:CR=1 FL=1
MLQFLNWKREEAINYDVISFEPNVENIPQLLGNIMPHQSCLSTYNIIPCAVGCDPAHKLVAFDGWQLAEFGGERWRDRLVPTFDFTSWFLKIYNNYKEIIIKMDLEGAEYRLLPELIERKAINYITDLFPEFHGERRGFSMAKTNKLIELLYENNCTPYIWEPSSENEFILKYNPSIERARIIPMGTDHPNIQNFPDIPGYVIENVQIRS